MIVYSRSIEGPGGRVEWNSQGNINCELHLGKINGTKEEIELVSTSLYIEQTNAYMDIKKRCTWLDGTDTITEFYEIVFLYVTDDYFKDYIDEYTNYANVMIANFNNDDGINRRLLQGIIQAFDTIKALKEYVEKNANNSNILAFFGTTTNAERDAISDILVKYDKLLFSVHPSEGERCYENIIQVGRYPNHYAIATASFAWHFSPSRKCAIVVADSNYTKNIGDMIYQTILTVELMNCSIYPITDDYKIDNFTTDITNYTDDNMIIFTLLGGKIDELLGNMKYNNLTSDVYTVVSLDSLPTFVTTEDDRWVGHYILTSYLYTEENDANDVLVKTFSTAFGNSDKLLNEHSINMYSALTMLKNAYEQSTQKVLSEIKRQLNQLTLSLPIGTVSVNSDNCFSNFYAIMQINETFGFEIKLSNLSPMKLSPYLTYRDDGKNETCELSSSSSDSAAIVIVVIINQEEESVFFLMNQYMVNNNELDTSIQLVKYYCDNVTASEITESNIVVTSCSVEYQTTFIKENPDLLLISIVNKNEDVCKNKIIELGTFPSQRIISFVSYFMSYFSPNVMVLVSSSLVGTAEDTLLNNTIENMGGFIKDYIVIDESNITTALENIQNFVSAYKLSIPDGGVFLNYLTNRECHDEVFKVYNQSMMNTYSSVEEAAKDYPIMSWQKEYFIDLDPRLKVGHYVIASLHADKTTASKVYDVGINLFGDGYFLPKVEARAIVAYEILMEVYIATQDFSKDSVYNYINSNPLTTSFGEVKISDDDTTIPFPLTAVSSNSDGDLIVKQVLSTDWPAQSYRHSFNLEEYTICSKERDGNYTYPSLKFLFLIPFSGDYTFLSNELINGYLAAVDYINQHEKGIHGMMIIPEVINIANDVEIAKSSLARAVNESKTLIVFGSSITEIRKEIIEDLEENGLILFYPFLYEGYECSKNIIYMNSPFTEYVLPTISFVYRSLSSNIFILYTDNERNAADASNAAEELEKRGINVIRSLRIPVDQYQMNIILNIIVNEMKQGVILSFLEGESVTDFLKELHNNNYDSNTYEVVSFNLELSQIIDDDLWQFFNGHYFVNGLRKEYFKDKTIIDIANNRYSFITEEPAPLPLLSVIIAARALSSIEFNQSEEIPYTFDAFFEAIHKVDVSNIVENVTINSNNQLSFFMNLVKVNYDVTSKTHTEEVIISLNHKTDINPYSTQYNNNGEMYYCEWSSKVNTTGSKIKRNSKNVALLYAITGSNSAHELLTLDVMIGEIDTMNIEEELEDLTLNYKIYDVSVESEIKNIAIEIAKDPSIVLVIGCSNNYCRTTVSEAFNETEVPGVEKKTLWYPATSEGQECKENVYYTGLVPNLYAKQLSSFIDQTSVENNIFLIGMDDESDRIIHNVFYSIFKDLYTMIGEPVYVSSGKGTTYTYIDDLVANHAEGAIIISTLDFETTIDFINYFDTMVYEDNKYMIVTITQDRDITNSLKITGGYIQNYICGSFFDEISPECDYLQSVKYHYGDLITNELAHSSYLALKFWAKSQLPNSQLYSSEINGCTGPVMMFSSNHISLPYYIMQINKDMTLTVAYSQTRIQEPQAWNWELEGFDGKICDFSNDNVGSIGNVDTITVVVALSVSGSYREYDMYVLNIYELLISEINNRNNGLLGTRVIVQSYDIESNDNTCNNLLTAYLEQVEKGKGVIFTTATSACIQTITDLLDEKDIPLFQVGYTGGESCYDNVFNAMKEPSFIDRIIDYIMEPTQPETLNFCTITTNDEIGISYYNYIVKYLNFVGANSLYTNNGISLDITSFDEIVNVMVSKARNGCYLLFVGTPNIHKLLDASINSIASDYKLYPIVSFTTASNAGATGVKPFYSAQTYFTNLDNTVNIAFKEDMLSLSTYASEIMYTSYVMCSMYLTAVNEAGSTGANKLRTTLYEFNYKSPSGGEIKMYNNNFMEQYIIYGKLKENDPEFGFDIIFTSAEIHLPQVYKKWINDGSYICNFEDMSIGDYYQEATTTIGVITSFSGDYNTTERSIAQGIIVAVDELNANGGILGKKIQLLIRDAQSKADKYLQYGQEFTRLDEVTAVFGAGRAEINDMLVPYFDQNKKLFFYPGISLSESCPQYTFGTQLTVNQLVNGVWKQILPYTHNVYIIQGDSKWSLQFSNALQALCNQIQLNLHVYNLTELLSTDEIPENFDYKNLDRNSAVILAVSEDNNYKAFNWLCPLNINMSNTYVVAVTMDRYLMEYIPAECMTNAYILTSFIKEMGLVTSDSNTYLSTATDFVSTLMDRFGKNVIVTAAMESGYTSVKLWADVVVAYTMSFDTEKVRSALYGYTMMAPSGTVEMNAASIINRIVYLCLIEKDKSLRVTEYASNPEQAEAWIHNFPENEGYKCDWTIPESRYRPDTLKIIFFHETTQAQLKEVNAMIIEYSLVQDINYNGINGYNIVPVFIFAADTDEFGNKTAEYLNDQEVVAFFGCQTSVCMNNALAAAKQTEKLYVYYGFTEGKSCYPYRLAVGTTASQRFLSAEQYIHKQGINSLIFLSDNSELMNTNWEIVYYYVKEHYSVNKQTISRITIEEGTDSEINNAINTILKKKEDDENGRIAVLYYLKGEISLKFIQTYISNSINSREVLITFLNFDKNDYTDSLLSEIYGSLVVQGYEESLSTAISQSFVNDAKGYIGINTAIDDNVEAIKDSFAIWEELYPQAVTDSEQILPPLRYLQLTGIGLEVEVPSGLVKVSESFYVSRNSYVFEINRNAKFIQLFPSRGSNSLFEPEPYPEGLPKECKYGKDQVYFNYSVTIEAVSYTLMALSMLVGISCLIFVIIHRQQSIIRTFGRAHNFITAIALIFLSFSSIPMASYPSSSNSVCAGRVVVLGLAVKGLLGVLFATESKLYQKHRRIRGSIRKTKITIFRVLSFWLGFMIFEAVLLLIWFTVDPNEYVGTYSVSNSDYFNEVSIRECVYSTPFTVIELISDFLPAVVLVFMSNSTKNIANEHNDSLGMFISSIVILVLGAIMVLLDFNVSSEPDSALLLRSMGIHLTAIIVGVLQYGLKLVSIYIDEDAKNVTSSGSAGGNNSGGMNYSTSKNSSHKSLSNMSFTTNMSRTFTTQTKTQMSKFATLTKQ